MKKQSEALILAPPIEARLDEKQKERIVRSSVYLPESLHRDIRIKLLTNGDRQSYTALVEQLLRQWLIRG